MPTVPKKILFISGKSENQIIVVTLLRKEKYLVTESEDRATVLLLSQEVIPHIIIVDLSIGQSVGFSICIEIRKHSNVPIVVLAEKDQAIDEAIFLTAGADDYLIKPLNPEVLVLRLAIQIRHRLTSGVQYLGTLEINGLALNLETRDFSTNGTNIPLTRIEFDFMRLLMESPKRVHTRKQVFEAIGGSTQYSSDHLLDTHASRLRLKIKSAGGPKVITAVRGVGFRLLPASEASDG
jgi:DNA-binding response OmpR family regulator